MRAAGCRLSGEGRLTPRRERPGGVRCAVQRLAEAPLKLDTVRTRAPDAQPELPLPVLSGVDRGHLVDAQRAQRLFAVLRLEAREALLRQNKPELATREVGTEVAAHQARLGRREECRRRILARVVGARARSLARVPVGSSDHGLNRDANTTRASGGYSGQRQGTATTLSGSGVLYVRCIPSRALLAASVPQAALIGYPTRRLDGPLRLLRLQGRGRGLQAKP